MTFELLGSLSLAALSSSEARRESGHVPWTKPSRSNPLSTRATQDGEVEVSGEIRQALWAQQAASLLRADYETGTTLKMSAYQLGLPRPV